MINQGKGEVGRKGFLVYLHHGSSLIFTSYQSRQISQDCSIPYVTGPEKKSKDRKDLAEHEQLTPNALTTYEQTYTANN